MRSSTKVALVLGGVTAVSGGLVWYLWDKGFGAGGGPSHGFTPWLFRGRPTGLSGGMAHSPPAGTVRGGFGTTAHAVSGSSGG